MAQIDLQCVLYHAWVFCFFGIKKNDSGFAMIFLFFLNAAWFLLFSWLLFMPFHPCSCSWLIIEIQHVIVHLIIFMR